MFLKAIGNDLKETSKKGDDTRLTSDISVTKLKRTNPKKSKTSGLILKYIYVVNISKVYLSCI